MVGSWASGSVLRARVFRLAKVVGWVRVGWEGVFLSKNRI